MASSPIILFDGVCNFCNRWVIFLIRHDRRKQFHFAALQSEKGRELLTVYQLPVTESDTFILIENNCCYVRSTAALKVMKKLGGVWLLVYGLIIIPVFIRDKAYDFIARHRYRWMGKRDSCMVPSQEVRDRFL